MGVRADRGSKHPGPAERSVRPHTVGNQKIFNISIVNILLQNSKVLNKRRQCFASKSKL